MSLRLARILTALLFGTAVLYGEAPSTAPAEAASSSGETAADPADKKSEPANEVPPYVLKNRSQFPDVAEDTRAPFWPIGWVKRKLGAPVTAEVVNVEPRIQLDEKSFKVTSILIGTGTTPSLAIINGRTYSEGEFMRLPRGGATPPPRIRVHRINDGNVILQHADQIVVAALQRPELSQRKSEELLLDPDR